MSRRRPVLAGLVSAALALPLTMGAAHAATPPPPTPDGTGLPVVAANGLVRPQGDDAAPARKITPGLAEAEGQVTAFVELDAPSGLDTAEAGGDAQDVEAATAEVEQLAEEVVPDAAADAAPKTITVTTDVVAGVVVAGDAQAIRDLAQRDAVTAVYLIVPKTVENKGTDVFTRALETWTATEQTGEGVRVGIIDTGVDYTHANFGGPGTTEAYTAAYGVYGAGVVLPGMYDPAKFLGGYDFAGPLYDASGETPGTSLTPTPDGNPIDAPHTAGGGHGTHVAGTAAGYGVLEDGTTFTGDYTTLDDISDWRIGPGSAPEAGIYALKVFGDTGGSTSLVINALEWAADPNRDGRYRDHLDIINLSLGSDFSAADDPENLFIDRLADLGVLSVISSGNGGDVTDIGGSPGNARSALTVANSVGNTQTVDAVEVTTPAELAGQYAAQNSVDYAGADDVAAPVAYLGEDVSGCLPLDTTYAPQLTGKIAYLWWDDSDTTRACGSAVRWNNAEAAGAVGVLIGTELPVFSAGIAGNATIPGAQLTASSTDALLPAIQAGVVTAHIGPSLANATFVTDPALGDTLNPGSSRGVHGSLGVVKPDVAAPGTLISSSASGTGNDSVTYSGTSMSAPHVTGISALVTQAHPHWTPVQIKAAVMNTATHDVYSGLNQSGPVYGPERVGSGRVDAFDATEADVLAFATDDPRGVSVTFGVVPVGSETVVLDRTVTVTNTGRHAHSYTTSFAGATTAGGATITTSPARITVRPGRTAEVTVRLTADPATLARDIDPTSVAMYDIGVPREYVATVSGRLVLTPGHGPALRVPVQAAPRLVSDMAAEPVAFADGAATTADLTLTGRGVASGGWTSLVAPLQLMVTSPALQGPGTGTSPSSVSSADLRYVGVSSTAPQVAAAGDDPSLGTLGIGIATEGEWASLGANVVPIIDTDIDGDGTWDLETYVWKYAPDLDFTTVETYALVYDPVTGAYALGDNVDLFPVNGLWADTDTSVFDSNVVVAPMSLGAVGITPGFTPTFVVAMYSPYAPSASGIVDQTAPFMFDPYDPPLWFDDGGPANSLWFDDQPGTLTVHRSTGGAATDDPDILLLHTRNTAAERAEVVPTSVPVATPTTTTLTVDGPLAEGASQHLVASVTPTGATGAVRFLDGQVELGTAAVDAGTATFTVSLAAGRHALQAVFQPDDAAWAGSASEVVTVEVTAREAARLTVAVPGVVQQGHSVTATVFVRSGGSRPTGTVEVREGAQLLATARVAAWRGAGVALVQLPRTLAVGSHHLTFTYTGNETVAPSSVDRDIRVVRSGRHGV